MGPGVGGVSVGGGGDLFGCVLLPGQGGIDALLSGLMLLIAAIVALPVLIRFLVPMTAAVSGGGGVGQIAMEGAAAATLARGLPQGAAQVSQDSATQESGSTQAGAPAGAAAVDGGSATPGGPSTGATAGEDSSSELASVRVAMEREPVRVPPPGQVLGQVLVGRRLPCSTGCRSRVGLGNQHPAAWMTAPAPAEAAAAPAPREWLWRWLLFADAGW